MIPSPENHVPDNFEIHQLLSVVIQSYTTDFTDCIIPTGHGIHRPAGKVFGPPITNSDMYYVGRNSEVMSPSLSRFNQPRVRLSPECI